MHSFVQTFEDGDQIYFGPGKFDEWCVYRVPQGGEARPPRDSEYFADLLRFGNRYGSRRIYSYFRTVYDSTGNRPTRDVLEQINLHSLTLVGPDQLEYQKVMTTIYYAMVAEENRKPISRYPLRKRIKKIGVFQVLIEGMEPLEAANYSRGRPARELERLLAHFEERERAMGPY